MPSAGHDLAVCNESMPIARAFSQNARSQRQGFECVSGTLPAVARINWRSSIKRIGKWNKKGAVAAARTFQLNANAMTFRGGIAVSIPDAPAANSNPSGIKIG
jgi:hypothetical protein